MDRKGPQAAPGADRAGQPPWLERLQDYYWIHDILRVSLGVPAWAMLWDGNSILWRDLSLVLPPLAPYHFEIALGKDGVRDAYHVRCLRQALDSGRSVEAELFGCRDLFVPVGRHASGRSRAARGGTVLYFGQYLAAPPDYEALGRQWLALSGRRAAPGDAEFDAYVSSVLALPVLPPRAASGLQEFGRLYAAFLRGEAPLVDLQQRLERLRARAFTPWLPHPVWAHQAIGYDAQRPVPWHSGQGLDLWMKQDLGLSRPPSTVLALLPLHQDPVRARVLGSGLYLRIWAWCRRRGGVTAARLNDEGVLLLAETPAGRAAAARAGLLRLAEDARAFAQARLKVGIVVGIGSPVHEGERLLPSYRQAVLALQLAVQEGRPVRFFEEADLGPTPGSYTSLARSARTLAGCFEGCEDQALALAAHEHVRGVLGFAKGRVDLARGQFLASFFLCLEALGRRRRIGEAALAALGAELGSLLERAAGLVELLGAFNSALRRLMVHASSGGRGASGLALQAFLAWLLDNHHRPLPQSDAARQAGLSVPVFTRAFRRATGSAFKPYLERLRCDEAARLLRATDQGVGEVALRCGFSSTHHLERAFGRRFGRTPGAYRRLQRPGSPAKPK